MSTDHMTNKQWRERCGKIVSINLNAPVSWEVFKELSKQTQEEYIKGLMENYGANATSLAAMFDVRPLTVRRYITTNELDVSFPVGHSMNAKQKLAWERFLADRNTVASTVRGKLIAGNNLTIDEADGDSCASAPQPVEAGRVMSMDKFSISFSGQIDVSMIANSLRHILGDSATGVVEIMCSLR